MIKERIGGDGRMEKRTRRLRWTKRHRQTVNVKQKLISGHEPQMGLDTKTD
jgi:hypothetical protein